MPADPERCLRGVYGIVDDGLPHATPIPRQAEQLLLGGVKVLQVRLKRTPSTRALALIQDVVAQARAADALILVNDRVDWALLCGADGVHVGDEDLSPQDARARLGATAGVGVTVRNETDAKVAQANGATYVGLGPVFATKTKRVPAEPFGVLRLAQVARASPLPVVAIGGIGLANIADVAQAGVAAAAVVSDALLAEDVAARVRRLGEAFEAGAKLLTQAQNA
ncbi:MAG: thiamine phosphate synthase [Myxococcaceae bacterium]